MNQQAMWCPVTGDLLPNSWENIEPRATPQSGYAEGSQKDAGKKRELNLSTTRKPKFETKSNECTDSSVEVMPSQAMITENRHLLGFIGSFLLFCYSFIFQPSRHLETRRS